MNLINQRAESDNVEPLVSILVLNYNGMQFLKQCFESLFKSEYSNFEVVLVDNNSTDESVEFTNEHYPNIKIIQTQKNAGYSRAYNIAFQEAKGKYFILLNNDVVVEKKWLEPLVKVAESDEYIGALQPKIRSLIDEGYFEFAGASGGFIDIYGYPFLRGRIFYTIEKDNGQYDNELEVFWTSGAAMFIRAEALKKCGNLDEDFVHHMEEIDLCWRLHLVGYKLMVVPKSVIHHYAGATIKVDSFKKLYWNHRNGIITLIKNLEVKNLIRILVIRYILDVINMIFAAFIQFDLKHAFSIVKAHVWIIFHLPLVLNKRKDVQRFRTVNDADIIPLMYQNSLVLGYFLMGKKFYSNLKIGK